MLTEVSNKLHNILYVIFLLLWLCYYIDLLPIQEKSKQKI